jgi:hypothetical protein
LLENKLDLHFILFIAFWLTVAILRFVSSLFNVFLSIWSQIIFLSLKSNHKKAEATNLATKKDLLFHELYRDSLKYHALFLVGKRIFPQ